MRKIRPWILRLLPAITAALLYFLLPHFPHFTEIFFSLGVFRVISVPLGMFTSIFPFSLTEILVLTAFPLLIFLIVRLISRLKKAGQKRTVCLKSLKSCTLALSAALLFYMLLHGVNFYRLPVEKLLDLNTARVTPENFRDVCIELASNASKERKKVKEDEHGRMKLSESVSKTLLNANESYKRLDDSYSFLWGGVWRPKPVMLSHYWSSTRICGMYFPFFAEANINVDQPDCDIPFTAAHELAHTRGFAREDECNFFAYLSCINSDSADARYSGYLSAYMYCIGELSSYDKDMANEANRHLSEAVWQDFEGRNEYWEQFDKPIDNVIGNISNEINNSFIESQGVEKGALSYGEVVRLIVAWHNTEAK